MADPLLASKVPDKAENAGQETPLPEIPGDLEVVLVGVQVAPVATPVNPVAPTSAAKLILDSQQAP